MKTKEQIFTTEAIESVPNLSSLARARAFARARFVVFWSILIPIVFGLKAG